MCMPTGRQHGLKLMGDLQADHEPSLPQAGLAENAADTEGIPCAGQWHDDDDMPLAELVRQVEGQPVGSSLPASSASMIACDGTFLVECPEDRDLHAKMDKIQEVELASFVAEKLERGGSSARQSLAHHTKKRAGRRKGSTNKPRTGQNKGASSGGTSTKRGRGRPQGSLNKPTHGQAAVQTSKAKTKAKTKAQAKACS
mmetsp:Transcript_29587/g.87517  ORF Transcript_29587/g.87517 Transcript_29587/m.87517 type:complete len:199 (-) Transcript_29587:1914-2510(-)